MQSIFSDTELQLTTERLLKYRGTAKINISQISCDPSRARQVDQSNIERLCQVFRKEGCHRSELQNHVTAIVTHRDLEKARQGARITDRELMTTDPGKWPLLSFSPGQILCLHGQHRLKAAAEVLAPSERWWPVDLYLDDISLDLRNTLIDEYANEKIPSDGDIYRKIRQYQSDHNAAFQKRWWARLSENKAKRLRQLMSIDNIDTCAAFDALLPIPGLWGGMSIGSLNRVLALRCDEEIIHYLKHVKSFWSSLVDDNREKMAQIDLNTVKALQLKAPNASAAEARDIKGLILSGQVFSKFSDSERKGIWDKLSIHDTIVPSLHTFFRDAQYLEACANAIKQLVEFGKNSPTIRVAMKNVFVPDRLQGACPVQVSEATFRSQPARGPALFELAYRQLWLFAMRHYPQLARNTKSKKAVAKCKSGAADQALLYSMAALSQKLGFASLPAANLLKMAPDRQIAREALLKARKPTTYQYDSGEFESLIDQVVECFAHAVAHETPPPLEIVLGDTPKSNFRCGPPREENHMLDSPLLFLDQIQKKYSGQNTVSSFYVRQSVYYAFFGNSLGEERVQDLDPQHNPQSPLFVPIDDHLNNTSNNDNADRRHQFSKGQSQREKQHELTENSGLISRADAFDANRIHRENFTHNREESFNTRASHSPTVMNMDDEDEFVIQGNAQGRQGIPSLDQEILPDAEQENQEEHIQNMEYIEPMDEVEESPQHHAETRSIFGDSDFDETSLLSGPENLRQNTEDISEPVIPPSTPPRDYAESMKIIPETEKNSASQERSSKLGGFPDEGERTNTFASDLPQSGERSEELSYDREAAEVAVLEALNQLENGSDNFTTNPVLAGSEHHPESNEAAQPEMTAEEPLSGISESNMVVEQGRLAKDARAAKTITQFEFTENILDITDLTTGKASNQQDPIGPQSDWQNKKTILSEPEESSGGSQANRKKPREKADHSDGPITAAPSIGEITIPSLGGELHPRRILPANAVTITFKAYEKGTWHVTDQIPVDAEDPSEAQRVAFKYARKGVQHDQHARFYNQNLRLVSAGQCVRAAMEDGSNTVLMSLGKDLKVTREKVAEVAEMFKANLDDQAYDDGIS